MLEGIKIIKRYLKYDYYFHNDTHGRNIYRIIVKRENKRISFKYGDSINNSGQYLIINDIEYNKDIDNYVHTFSDNAGIHVFKKPSDYDIYASLMMYDPGTFDNFCSDNGYDVDKINKRIYSACKKSYEDVIYFFTENEIEYLKETYL